MNTENTYTGAAVRFAGAHPYICTFLACVLINPFFFGQLSYAPVNSLYLEVIITALFAGAAVFYNFRKGKLSKPQAVEIMIIVSGIDLALAGFYVDSPNKNLWHFAGGCVLAAAVYQLSDYRKYKRQMNSFLILASGFFLKLYYILGTDVYTRQHDVGDFGSEEGHAGYIRYLVNYFHLPDFDIRERWQFCHPPLHHSIAAAWVYLNEKFFNVPTDQAQESIQILTLFYAMCIVISFYRILRYFKLEGMSLYLPLAVISFHPAFILFSGSINNDVLSAALVMGAVVTALEWYRNPTLRNIIKVALCIGCGMMAKLTAALVAPPVAFIFLVVFIKNIRTDSKNVKKFLLQFVIFGLICCPLGLWYQVRNYIKWQVPILYVQELPWGLLQNISEMDYVSRITDFSSYQFENVFENWRWEENGEYFGYNEHNPLIAIMKNSVFGEGINSGAFGESSALVTLSTVFFWVAVVLAVLSFSAMVASAFCKTGMNRTEKVFFASFYLVMMANLYKMAYDYPFTCTLNFRYITPVVIVQVLFLGTVTDAVRRNSKKIYNIIKYPVYALSGLFVVLSTVIYLSVCFER